MIFKNLLSVFLRIFYPKIEGADPIKVLASVFFLQKIVGFNRFVGWPVHFTSRILYKKNIKLGRRSFPGWSQGCYIQARNGIEIGSNLRLGPNVGIISSNHSKVDYDIHLPSNGIRIGDNVWIGMNSVILPEVIIGDNVIIGANSVVTKNIPSNTIAFGSPAIVVAKKDEYIGKEY